MVSRSAGATLTSALTTPETAITIQHTSASREKRCAASERCVPRRQPSASNAIRPPTHSVAATRWNSRLLVATSCAPPLAECPVTATGTSPPTARKNSVAVQPQDSARRQPSASSSAISAVNTHAFGCSIASTICSNACGSSSSVTGRPAASAAEK